MNKLCLMFFVFFTIVLTSCGTTRFIFDDSIPLEESAIVENQSPGYFTVTHVNGTPVNWIKSGTIEMQIPAGDTELMIWLHIDATVGNTHVRYYHPRVKINYNFVVGNKYRIGFWPDYNFWTGVFAEEQYFAVRNLTTRERNENVIIEFIEIEK